MSQNESLNSYESNTRVILLCGGKVRFTPESVRSISDLFYEGFYCWLKSSLYFC